MSGPCGLRCTITQEVDQHYDFPATRLVPAPRPLPLGLVIKSLPGTAPSPHCPLNVISTLIVLPGKYSMAKGNSDQQPTFTRSRCSMNKIGLEPPAVGG